jgi:hypothetical protein
MKTVKTVKNMKTVKTVKNMKNMKRIETKSLVTLLLLITVVIASVPQTLAKPQYASTLDTVYGVGSCTTCHTDPSDGKSFTDYGSKFHSQSVYKNDPVTALKNIGTPPGAAPVVTTTVVSTPAVTNTGTVVPTETEHTVTEPKVTIPAVVETTVKPVETTEKEDDEKSGKGTETEETRAKSPGFGIVATIGIVLTLYIVRMHKVGKR